MRGFLLAIAVLAAMTGGTRLAAAQTTGPGTSGPLPHSTAPPVKQSTPPAPAPSNNPYDPKVRAMARELAHTLSDRQVQALAEVRTNFGMVRAVRNVQSDVARAAEACSKDNPALKSTMSARYNRWREALAPALLQAEKDLNQVVASGIAGNRRKVEAYLNMIDRSAIYADKHLDKRPVTTPKACEGLLASMDRTQDTLASLLKTIKWPQENTAPAAPARPGPSAGPRK